MALFRVEQPLKLLQCNMDILTVTARLRVSRLKYHDLKFFRIRDRSILARSPPANCTTNPLKKKQEKSQSCGSMWNLYILDCPSFSDNIPSLCRRSWTDWCVEKLCFSGRQRIIWAKAADTQRSGWPDAKIVIFFCEIPPWSSSVILWDHRSLRGRHGGTNFGRHAFPFPFLYSPHRQREGNHRTQSIICLWLFIRECLIWQSLEVWSLTAADW